jgi:GTP-binding protein
MGGPDGGDGGTGGDVWLVVDHNVSSLIAFKDHPHRAAKSGTHGRARASTATAATTSSCPCPRARS